MAYLPLLKLSTLQEYLLHYKNNYSKVEVRTWDEIVVHFPGTAFYHLFYEDSNRDGKKDQFSWLRSERMDWIKAALTDAGATLYQGWNNKLKHYDPTRRLVLTQWNYVVVIKLLSETKAEIVTHYLADESTLRKLKLSPPWKGYNIA